MKIDRNATEDQYILLISDLFNSNKQRYMIIPFSAFEYYGDIRIIGFHCTLLRDIAEHHALAVEYVIDYVNKSIIFFREKVMRSKFTIEIPYLSRSKYKDFICRVNETVEESGCCIFFISNIVPHLKSYLVVETNDYGSQIESFIKEYGLCNDTSKSLDEFYVEMQTRQWDCCTLRKSENTDFLFDLYAFNEEDVLETKGYKWKPARKQKLFISYCHNDANVVHEIVNSIQRAGIHVWIDTEEIDAGDRKSVV